MELAWLLIHQVAAPDGGVMLLGSVDVGGKSREGWRGMKERTKKEALGRSKVPSCVSNETFIWLNLLFLPI